MSRFGNFLRSVADVTVPGYAARHLPGKAGRVVERAGDFAITMGGSELWRNRDVALEVLRKAASAGWEAFEAQCRQVLGSLQHIRSLSDVVNLVKVFATGGANILAQVPVDAVQTVVMQYLGPYLDRLAEWVGKNAAESRQYVKENSYSWLRGHLNLNRVAARIGSEVAVGLYDLALGVPECVCEQGCIKPVADGLAKGGNPYVKAVGQALKVIYPIVQGHYTGLANSQASWYYASGGLLLPSAKIPGAVGGTISRVLKAVNSSYAAGMPQSYETYEPWLVDAVARGATGPRLYGGPSERAAKYYFEHPQEAASVLEKADKLSRLSGTVNTWLNRVNAAIKYGGQAYDLYAMAKRNDFKVDVAAYKERGIAYAKEQAAAAKSVVKQIPTVAKQAAKNLAQAPASIATSVKSSVTSTSSKSPQAKQLSGLVILQTNGLGAISTGEAFMGEWQLAEIGVRARARFEAMAELWLSSTPEQLKAWQKKDEWKTKAIDWPGWYATLSRRPALNRTAQGKVKVPVVPVKSAPKARVTAAAIKAATPAAPTPAQVATFAQLVARKDGCDLSGGTWHPDTGTCTANPAKVSAPLVSAAAAAAAAPATTGDKGPLILMGVIIITGGLLAILASRR